MDELFEPDYGVDNSPIDSTQITTTILYYSEEELEEFKKLAKKAMRQKLGIQQAQEKGNISDIVLNILREKYGEDIQAPASNESAGC